MNRKTSAAATACVLTICALSTATPVTAGPQDSRTRLSSEDRASGQQNRKVTRAARASRARASLVRVALAQRGESYRAGAAGPSAFDCSGFTMYVYRTALGKSLPHYSGAQMTRARPVSIKSIQPGDLIFYGAGGSQHVSLYIGKGKMIHATNPRRGVQIDSIRNPWYWSRMSGVGRIVEG